MKKPLFLILILLTGHLYFIPFSFGLDEGYGEESRALGQMVDTFENSTFIAVQSNIIQNSTTDCIEVNTTGGAGPWLDYYAYRKQITVSQLADADENYTIRLDAHYGSGADSGDDIYLNSHTQADFDDVNFTESDCVTTLSYWKSRAYASDNCTFWVRLSDNLTDAAVVIYIYYGNATIGSFSDGSGTFVEYWDMEGTPGNAPTGWDDDSSANCDFTLSNTFAHTGTTSVRGFDNNNNGWSIGRLSSNLADSIYCIHWFAYFPQDGSSNALGVYNQRVDVGLITDISNTNGNVYVRDDGTFPIVGTFHTGSWIEVEYQINYTSETHDVYYNRTLVADDYDFFSSQTSGKALRIISGKTFQSAVNYWYNDDVFVRRFVAGDQPSLAFGSEDSFGSAYFITTNYMNFTLANGTCLVLMVNSTIPGASGITVQFSLDNSTWVNDQNVSGSYTLTAGFESIDLRNLNFTVVYLMYNLTVGAVTPRLYQSRLITTIGGAGGVAGPSGGSGAIGFIMLSLICTPLILLLWGRRRR